MYLLGSAVEQAGDLQPGDQLLAISNAWYA
jgi:hypothetical protein